MKYKCAVKTKSMDETPPALPSPLTPTPNTHTSLWTTCRAINHRMTQEHQVLSWEGAERKDLASREREMKGETGVSYAMEFLQIKFLERKRVQKWQSVRKALVKGWSWKRRHCKPAMEESWLSKWVGRAGFLLERNTGLREDFPFF